MSTDSTTSAGVKRVTPEETSAAATEPVAKHARTSETNGGAHAAAAIGKGRLLSDVRDPAHDLAYLNGFGEGESEALPGALPVGQNNPQKCPYGLYAEQITGTAFTAPRMANQRSWMYRIRPACVHPTLVPMPQGLLRNDFTGVDGVAEPNQRRWPPIPLPAAGEQVDFVDGLKTFGGSGSIDQRSGFAIHMYAATVSMGDRCFCNSDGDLLFVPQLGAITLRTEFGVLHVPPRFIAVVPRGIRFSVDLAPSDATAAAAPTAARGYVLEVYNGHFRIPDLGPIGANGLANPRDFQKPEARYEDRECRFTLVQKFLGKLFRTELDRSPYDVVAWHGNYAPFRYNLDHFVTVNSVSVDHLDPSIFTVLTCPTVEPGVACADFVIFPPRWCVQTGPKGTFRIPYYHRNYMGTEYMGNIEGAYEAKPQGFSPGASSLHACMIAHGPDAASFKRASVEEMVPVYAQGALAFMFESVYTMRLTEWAATQLPHDKDYQKCWEGMPVVFDAANKDAGYHA